MKWWFQNGLAGWAILSTVWGVLSIVYDIAIEAMYGTQSTISWQTQQVSIANPVVPMAVGLVAGGLACHFFKVRTMGWFEAGQPWHYYAIGFVAGAFLIALTWTQRG